ncbi:dual specificity protein kinase [Pelomyxa schiedti]|nr:dual specificity protein kinase [Pelomyxa schiedti]
MFRSLQAQRTAALNPPKSGKLQITWLTESQYIAHQQELIAHGRSLLTPTQLRQKMEKFRANRDEQNRRSLQRPIQQVAPPPTSYAPPPRTTTPTITSPKYNSSSSRNTNGPASRCTPYVSSSRTSAFAKHNYTSSSRSSRLNFSPKCNDAATNCTSYSSAGSSSASNCHCNYNYNHDHNGSSFSTSMSFTAQNEEEREKEDLPPAQVVVPPTAINREWGEESQRGSSPITSSPSHLRSSRNKSAAVSSSVLDEETRYCYSGDELLRGRMSKKRRVSQHHPEDEEAQLLRPLPLIDREKQKKQEREGMAMVMGVQPPSLQEDHAPNNQQLPSGSSGSSATSLLSSSSSPPSASVTPLLSTGMTWGRKGSACGSGVRIYSREHTHGGSTKSGDHEDDDESERDCDERENQIAYNHSDRDSSSSSYGTRSENESDSESGSGSGSIGAQGNTEQETWIESQKRAGWTSAPHEIKPSELELQKNPFGRGYFGKVFAGILVSAATPVAVKQIENVADPRQFLEREALPLRDSSGHENIVRLMGAHVFLPEGSQFYTVQLVMPKACTDLGKLIHDPRHVPSCLKEFIGHHNGSEQLRTNVQLARQMARPVAFLHGILGVIHRDIKPQNFLVDEGLFRIQMCDFGCCSKLPQGRNSLDVKDILGDVRYFAPELLEQVAIAENFVGKYVANGKPLYAEHTASTATDVYSLGLTFCELFTGRDQFQEDKGWRDREELYRSICVNGERPDLPRTMHPLLRDLIARMWDPDPAVRPSIKEVTETLTAMNIGLEIQNSEATQWWINNFGVRETVEWQNFVTAIAGDTNEYLPGIKKLACDDKTETLTTKRFSELVKCLGLGFMAQKSLLTEMNKWTREHWFLPFATDQDCTHLLTQEGEFLVRIQKTGLEFCIRRGETVEYEGFHYYAENGQPHYVYDKDYRCIRGNSPIDLIDEMMQQELLEVAYTEVTYDDPMQLTRIVKAEDHNQQP